MMSVTKPGVLLALLLFAVLALLALDNELKVQGDSGIYITLAKSLTMGKGYREIFFVNQPLHTLYPPMFPVLLAPLISVFGYNFLTMKLLMVALGMITLYLLYIFYRDVSDDWMALLVVVFTATSHGILFYSQSIMTEIPYLFFSLLALLWLHKCSRQEVWSGKAVAIAIVLISLAYLTRLIGLSLLLASVAYLICDSAGRLGLRIKRAFLIGGLTAIPALLWFLRNWWIDQSTGTAYLTYYSLSLEKTYASQSTAEAIISLVGKLYHASYEYALHAGRIILYYLPSESWIALPLLLALLTFGGFLWCAVYKRTIVEYYVGFYMGALLLFLGSRQQRYLIPLLPFIWYYFFIAGGHLLSWLLKKTITSDGAYQHRAVLAAKVLLVFLLIANGAAAVLEDVVHRGKKGYYGRISHDGYVSMVQWVKGHTPQDSVFMWAKPSLGLLLTGRKAARMPQRNAEAALHSIRAQKVDYVVIDSLAMVTQHRIRPVVEQYPDDFRLVYANEVSQVYQVVKPPRASASPSGG